MLAPASRRHPFTPTRTPLFGRRPALPREPWGGREAEALGDRIGRALLSLINRTLCVHASLLGSTDGLETEVEGKVFLNIHSFCNAGYTQL